MGMYWNKVNRIRVNYDRSFKVFYLGNFYKIKLFGVISYVYYFLLGIIFNSFFLNDL